MKSGITVLGNPEGKDGLASEANAERNDGCPPDTRIHPDPAVRRSDGKPVCLTKEQLAVYNERHPSEEEVKEEGDVSIGHIFDGEGDEDTAAVVAAAAAKENEPRLPNDLIAHCRKYNTGKSGNLTGQNYIGPEGSSGPIRKRRKKAITSCRMDKICRTIAGKNDGGHKDPSKRKCVLDSSKSNAELIAAFEELSRACRGEDCPPVEAKKNSDDEDEVLVPAAPAEGDEVPVPPVEGEDEGKGEDEGDEVPVPPVEGKGEGEGKGDDEMDLTFSFQKKVRDTYHSDSILWQVYEIRDGLLSYSYPVQATNFISDLSTVDNKINRLNAWEFLYTKLFESAQVTETNICPVERKI